MDTYIENLSSPGLVNALEANMVEFWKAYGRASGRQLDERADLVRVMTGIPFPLFNGIYRARLSPGSVETAIEETRLAAEQWHAPLFWWIMPGTEPPGLGNALVDRGFIHAGSSPGMAVELALLDARLPLPHNLTIQDVDDEQTLDTWSNVAAVGTGFPPPIREMLRSLDHDIGLYLGTSLRRYLGFLNGVPVATSCMVLDSGVAGIYAVATMPEARRRGVGAAMTRIPLLQALAEGYKVGTLQASEMGHPVYSGLGFRGVCEVSLYLLSLESKHKVQA